MKLGFIGLGAMGRPMAKRLADAFPELYVYDVVEEAVEELVSSGATRCADPAGVAEKADLIFMSLPNGDIVGRVVTGDNGVLTKAKKGMIIVDLSSVAPDTTRKMAAFADKKGVIYMDAPVSGGVAGAQAGTLTIMLGGKPESVEKVMPALEIIGKNIKHVGDVGAGDAVKIVNNLLLGANMAALAEAVVLGKKLGLSADIMLEIIGSGSGKSYVLDAKFEKFIMNGNFAPGFAVDLQYKDLGLAQDAAKSVNMPLPMTVQAIQLFETARAKGLGGEDISAVVKVWEDLMNVDVRKEES